MNRKERIQQRINEAQQRWALLSKRIQAVTRDLSLSLEGQRQVVYQEQLAALKKERDEVEAELDRLEQGQPNLGSGGKEAKTLPTVQSPARLPFEPEMVLIPAGEFLMGDDLQRVHLSDYYIAKTPITNAQYRRFVQASGRSCPYHWKKDKVPEGKEHHPVVHVSWHDAVAYCSWLSQVTSKTYRLPTEQEWEKAARGTDGRKYPWGNKWQNSLCNTKESGIGDTTPVGRYSPKGDSPFGCADMAGNVWEWAQSWYDESKEYRVLRGGLWGGYQDYAQCTARIENRPLSTGDIRGFRCVSASSAAQMRHPIVS